MHGMGIYRRGTASSREWQDCHAWEIGERNIYNFLQVGKLVVGNLFKYLLSREVKSYLFISSKIFITLLEEK